ncbi:hypothetical protein [Streptosporangium sp. KLBMP 9127]|nr:hypothetical protein [Streptosporangium sp. KLBMP 9127]
MAAVIIDRGMLVVRFEGWERLFARRGDVQVPMRAVREADLVERPLRAVRGARSGISVSGVLKVGVWGLGVGIRQLVSARHDVPGLRVEVDRAVSGLPFDELIISTPDAAALVRTLKGVRA